MYKYLNSVQIKSAYIDYTSFYNTIQIRSPDLLNPKFLQPI